MFINISKIINIAAVIGLASLAASCARIDDLQGQEVGYLTISGLDVDVTVDMVMPTKSVALPEISAPTDVVYKVTDAKGSVYQSGTDSWAETLVIAAGDYTVEAWSGENGFGAPYFYGSETGTIGAENKAVSVTLSVENSLVAVTVGDDLKDHFTPGTSVVLTSGGQSYTADYGKYCFVPSGADISLFLSGTNSAGVPAGFTYELTSPARKTAYEVICSKASTNWPSISLSSSLDDGAFEGGLYFSAASVSGMSSDNSGKLVYQIKAESDSDWDTVEPTEVSGYLFISGLSNGTKYSLRACVGNIVSSENSFTPVAFADCLTLSSSAAHTKNSAGELDGTAVSASVTASLPSVVASLATTTATGTFATSGGTTRSSAAPTSLNENGTTSLTMQNDKDWPYIPQSSGYVTTLNASCTIGSTTYTATKTATVNVPAPSFTLALSSYTSYDKYAETNGHTKVLSNDEGTGANDCDPETLYNAGGQWGVSTALMSNANYAKTLVINLDGKDTTYQVNDYNYFYQNFTGLSWSSHSLNVSFTFDGVTVSKSRTHHITGLPYNKNKSVPVSDDWTVVGGNASYNESYVQISSASGYGKIASPKFNIPTGVDVTLYTKIGKGGTATYHQGYWHQYNGSSTSDEVLKSNTGSEVSVQTSMSNSYNQWLLSTDWLVAAIYIRLYYLSLEYR